MLINRCLSSRFVVLLIACLLVTTTATGQSQYGAPPYADAYAARLAGDYERSIALYVAEIAKLDSVEDLNNLARGYRELGRVHEAIANYPEAMSNYGQSLRLYEKDNDLEGQVICLVSFGYFYEIQFAWEQALSFYDQALSVAQRSQDDRTLGMVLTPRGSLLAAELGRWEEGMTSIDTAIAISLRENDSEALAIAYNEKAKAFGRNDDFTTAIRYYQKSYAIDLHQGSPDRQVISENNIAAAYYLLGELDSAKHYVNKALAKSTEFGLLDDIRLSYRILAYTYREEDKLDEAFAAFENYQSYSDSVLVSSKMEAIHRVQAQYEADLKDAQIASLQQKEELQDARVELLALNNERKQNWLVLAIVGAVLLLLVGGLVALRVRTRHRQKLLEADLEASEQKRKAEAALRVSEVKAIKAQLNPHFIFNVLSSLQFAVQDDDKEKAMRLLGKFSELMRTVMLQSERPWISMQEELQMLENYVSLHGIRMGSGGIDYQVSVNLASDQSGELIDVDDIMIPALLIQPLLENAIRHGLESKRGDRKIRLRIDASGGDTLRVSVEDNGIGRSLASKVSPNGSGLSLGTGSVKQRLQHLLGKRNSGEVLHIVDVIGATGEQEGTRVSFEIPFIYEDQADLKREELV